MGAIHLEADRWEQPIISSWLICFSIGLQVFDAAIALLNMPRGLFSFPPGPVGHLLGLGPLPVWLLMKISCLLVLMLAVLNGRRWLLLLLDIWVVAFAAFLVFVHFH